MPRDELAQRRQDAAVRERARQIALSWAPLTDEERTRLALILPAAERPHWTEVQAA
jgi:hypothetical protein